MRNFEMFTESGNQACDNLVNKVVEKIKGKERVSLEEIISMTKKGIKEISSVHREIYDSEPPTHIAFYIRNAFKDMGYSSSEYIDGDSVHPLG